MHTNTYKHVHCTNTHIMYIKAHKSSHKHLTHTKIQTDKNAYRCTLTQMYINAHIKALRHVHKRAYKNTNTYVHKHTYKDTLYN